MILVDTSVWVDHLRHGNGNLVALLNKGDVACHPFVLGEIMCGNLKNRKGIARLLQQLPIVKVARDQEVLQFIEDRRLHGRGLGYVAVHLLASALLNSTPFWTLDKLLRNATEEMQLAWVP